VDIETLDIPTSHTFSMEKIYHFVCGECKKSCRICKRHWGNCFKYEYRKNSQKTKNVEFF